MTYLKQNLLQEWASYLIGSEPYRYHCWHRSPEQWSAQGKVHHTFGLANFFGGLIFMITNALILWAFHSHPLMKSSCYKILCALGVISWFEIGTMSMFPAFVLFRGAVFCNYPVIGMVIGRTLTMEWIAGSTCCLFLALNRIADMTRNIYLLKLFHNPLKVILIFLSIFLFSLTFALFTDPCLYNSNLRGFSILPYNEMDPELFSLETVNIYNAFFMVTLAIITLIVLYKLCTENENCWRGTSDLQRKIMIQSGVVCLQYVIPCLMYLIIYLWSPMDPPQCFIEGTHILFQLFACFSGTICLVLNRPIRVKFLEKIGLHHYVIQPNRRATVLSITRSIM